MKPEPPADLWEQVAKLHEEIRIKRPGPEWFTYGEYATKFNVGHTTAQNCCRRLAAEGKLERVGTGCGKPAFFRVVKQR